MIRFIATLLLVCAIAVPSAFARPFTTAEKIADFRGFVNTLHAGYGPRDYKAQERGLALDVIANRYEAEVAATSSNKEFYYTIARFIAEFKDGHFGVNIPTDHVGSLPLGFDLVNGRVLLDWVDEERLPKSVFPFERGDELVAFDGQPITEVLADVKRYIPSGSEQSITRIAAWSIAFRRGARLPVKTGELGRTAFVIAKTGREVAVTPGLLRWDERGLPLSEQSDARGRAFAKPAGINYDELSVRENYQDFIGDGKRFERSFACNGGTRGTIPSDWVNPEDPSDVRETVVIMAEPFLAYYHYDPRFEGYVGYLRIPHYSPVDAAGNREPEVRFAQYEYAVEILEANTKALIIDQDHNCGGSVTYLEQILGLFFNEPYQPMQFQLLASEQSKLDFQSWLSEVPENTRDRKWLEAVLELISSTWEEGSSFLTEKTAITGRPLLPPNEITYTKPIIVLIDEIAGSGGDAFPGIMASRPQTKLLGTRTSGLGGHVEEFPRFPNSQTGGRYTKSLFYRADGVPVENNGAVPAPGYEYTITYNDFVDGYREYQAFYLQKLLELVAASR